VSCYVSVSSPKTTGMSQDKAGSSLTIWPLQVPCPRGLTSLRLSNRLHPVFFLLHSLASSHLFAHPAAVDQAAQFAGPHATSSLSEKLPQSMVSDHSMLSMQLLLGSCQAASLPHVEATGLLLATILLKHVSQGLS